MLGKIQHKSDGFKYGAPPDHENSVQVIVKYLRSKDMRVITNWRRYFDSQFVEQHKLQYYIHNYDITAWKKPWWISDNEDPFLVVEIDGQIHGKKAQRIKDGIAQAYIEYKYPRCKFVRIQKEDVYYPAYLQKQIGF